MMGTNLKENAVGRAAVPDKTAGAGRSWRVGFGNHGILRGGYLFSDQRLCGLHRQAETLSLRKIQVFIHSFGITLV